MIQRVKNFLFNLCKKKTILFVFFFSFFGLTFARSVSANWVLDIIFGIPLKTILLIMWVITQLTTFLAELCGKILNWVLSPGFIEFSYTKPGPSAPDNPIIEVGLGVTQGFVNMLLVLILVYIAIATILRLAGYETKKLLITFIIVALLVNFAPVICGLIVDASNIVMNFFIQDLGADAFGAKMSRQVSDIMFDWKNATWEKSGDSVLQLYILNGFLFVLSFILLLFTIIFILRYLVIWILVILSPLAFACYILPMTKKYFDLWWKQFIAWSFIGVTCGFFLYLGLLFVSHVPAAIPSPTTGQGGLFDRILPYFVSVIFLGLGLVFGLQTSAIGAKVVIQGAKRGGKAGSKVAAQKGWKWTKQGAAATKRLGESALRTAARIGEKTRRTYQTARRAGVPRSQAAGEAIWRRRPWRPAARRKAKRVIKEKVRQAPATIGKGIWAASKGVLSAVKDVAVAGTTAALFKKKVKKKGIKNCPACNRQNIAKSAKVCPTCGYDFE